jgi:hypothetical protein
MTLMTALKPYIARALTAFILVGGTSALTLAQTEANTGADYAILIVGNESDAEVLRKEKVLIQEIAKTLRKQPRLPIYSYHFNKERERTYCEKKLGVLKEDLLFIGIVSLVDRVPRKIVYRIDRIVTPARAAQDILSRADELTGAQEAPSASPSPQAPVTPTSTGTPNINTTADGRYRVQLGVFTQQKFAQDLVDQLKGKGYDAKFDKGSTDGRDAFRVWVGTFGNREDAQQAVGELKSDGFEQGFVIEVR